MRIFDISRNILETDVYPGDPAPRVDFLKTIGDDCCYNLSQITICPHTGTHIDAPAHFIENGKTIEQCPIDAFIGPCTVVETRAGVITGEEAENLLPEGCERLIIKGGGRSFFMDSSAEYLAGCGIKLIGTDSLSIGCEGNELKPHRAFLGEEVAILEGLDLTDVPAGNYFLFAPPVKIGGIEGSPTRAVLIADYIFWSGK